MRFRRIRAAFPALSLVLLLAACQAGPNPRYYAQPDYRNSVSLEGSYCTVNCYSGSADIRYNSSPRLLSSTRVCPPGHVLVRTGYWRRACRPLAIRKSYAYGCGAHPACGGDRAYRGGYRGDACCY